MQIIISWPHIVYLFCFNTIHPPPPTRQKNNLQNDPNFQAVPHIQKKPIVSLATEMRKMAGYMFISTHPTPTPTPKGMCTC